MVFNPTHRALRHLAKFFLDKDKVIIQGFYASDMNRRTAQNQRKVRMPSIIRRRPKKEVTPKAVVETPEPSCQTTGCGCGN